MTTTLVAALLKRNASRAIWPFILSIALWFAIIGFPVSSRFQPAMLAALWAVSGGAMAVTFSSARDKSLVVLPLSRLERGRAIWYVATIGSAMVSALAVTIAATAAALLPHPAPPDPLWVATTMAMIVGVAGTATGVLSWRAGPAFFGRPGLHLALILATLLVAPAVAAWCVPLFGEPARLVTWIAILIGIALTVSGYRRADMLGVYQRAIGESHDVRTKKKSSTPTNVAIGPSRYRGRFAPLAIQLLIGIAVGAGVAAITPFVAALVLHASVADLVSTSPRADASYGTWVWMTMFAGAGDGPFWRQSPWSDRRLTRTLPFSRQEIVTFYLLRSMLPVAAFLGVTAALNVLVARPLPDWLHLPFGLFICGACAMAPALMRQRIPPGQFPSSSFFFMLGVIVLGLFRFAAGQSKLELDASVIGVGLIIAAAAIQRRRLITIGSSSVPKRSFFAPPTPRGTVPRSS